MRFVGIDSAYRHTGIVILGTDGRLISRHHLINPATTDPEGFLWWYDTFREFIMFDDYVALEGLSFGSVGRSHVLAGTYAICQLVTRQMIARTLIVVPPTRVKKWAVDDGKATKSTMIKWARRTLALPKKVKISEHEADALALADIARAAFAYSNGLAGHLDDAQANILSNKQGNGIMQVPGRSIFE